MQDISNFINAEHFDDIFIIVDFNDDTFKGRFFNIFEIQMLDHSLSFCDVIHLNASSFTYINQNSSAAANWLDHIVCSNSELVSQLKILYDDSLNDHMPIYCEIAIPCNNSETNLQDQHSENYHNKFGSNQKLTGGF